MTGQELQSLKNKFDIIGNDPALNRALEVSVLAAPTDLTILISGESGVGKENLPKIIHQYSRRRTGKYFAVNCGGIPEGTIDSELFGHEKGSFTGATEMRRGYFEEADGGTLFLDEVGELPVSSQAKLLRVLQSGEFIRVGSSKVLKTDVRVVAATNVNLRYAVSKGKFREDLYYRLNAVSVFMPPLRERPGDIHLLFRKFASDFSEKYGMAKAMLSEDAVALLKEYRWPGNIRQLKNIAETVSALEADRIGAKQEISAQVLAQYMPKEDANSLPVKAVYSSEDAIPTNEREAIFRMLYQLRQEVDYLKEAMSGGRTARPQLPQQTLEPEKAGTGGAYIPAEAPDEQGDGRQGEQPWNTCGEARDSRSWDVRGEETRPWASGSGEVRNSPTWGTRGEEAQSWSNSGSEVRNSQPWINDGDTPLTRSAGPDVLEARPWGDRSGDTGQDGRREMPDEQVGEELSLHKVGEGLIRKALEKHRGNRKQAAAELGISERTLYRKLKELDK